jgi:uncharacterized membrane protein YebE (DUF533 family)
MKRLTVGTRACTEILALLIHVAWADGKLADAEKSGIRAASSVFNLSKEQRARLDELMAAKIDIDAVLVEQLSAHEKAYAYVAAVWMTGIDEDVDDAEKGALDQAGDRLSLDPARRAELAAIARDLLHLKKGKTDWAADLGTLFKSIPKRLEPAGGEEVEVAFDVE